MRFILRQFAEEPEDGRGKCIFYVDLLDKATKLAKLKSVFPGIEFLRCATGLHLRRHLCRFRSRMSGRAG